MAATYSPERIGLIDTSRGPVTLWRHALDHYWAYVAVADWRPPQLPVVMYVAALPISRERLEVHLVFAAESTRFDSAIDGVATGSLATQIGRWLFAEGHLTHHSADRNAEGDRWAHHVGGILPERLPKGHEYAGDQTRMNQKAEAWYRDLCAVDWALERRRGTSD